MRGSWTLGDVFGIELSLHWTFLILLEWLVVASLPACGAWAALVEGLLTVLAVVACVVLHEMGHMVAYAGWGDGPRGMTILPFGGIPRMERPTGNPLWEIPMALAGPAANLAAALSILVLLTLIGETRPLGVMHSLGAKLLAQLLWINWYLALLNLLPAFPLDGGRVLRAYLLARCLPYETATRMAARLGKATAVVMALAGLLWNWWLILVAVLVYVSARTEIRNKGRNVAGSKGQVRDAMLTRFSTVSADATVNDVFDQLRDGCSWALPVVDHGRFLGIVDRDRFLEAIAASDWQRRAREFVQQKYPVLRETDPLEESWRRMQGDEFYLVPVVRADQLVGIVTAGSVRNWATFHGGRVRRYSQAP